MSAPVISIAPNAPIKQVLQIFLAHPIHHLPVVDADRRVVGMVSSADVLKLQFFMPASAQPVVENQWTVERLMRSPAIVVGEHESVQRCAELMASNGVHSLPVVDRDGALIGIVTTTDLMRCSLNPPPDAPSSVFDALKARPLADERVKTALASARRAVATNHDPYSIATTLLHMEQRVNALQAVAVAAKRYMNAGQDERLHVALAKAIERADRFDEATRHPAVLGLS
jgi:CBS domain-containing protein